MKVIIFEPNPDLATNPTLTSLVRRLSDDGVAVDIYQPDSGDYLPFEVAGGSVNLHNYHYDSLEGVGLDRLMSIPRALRLLWRIHAERRVVVIAVDPRGVIEAYRYCRWTGTPFVYFSFEIFFVDELPNDWWKSFKEKEIEASRKAALVVVQDEERGKLLNAENGLSETDSFYMPVSPASLPPVKRTDYLREKFKLPKEKMIVIYAGTFTASRSYAKELLESMADWPDEFLLLIHTRSLPSEEFKRIMADFNSSNVVFSTTPCDDLEYQELLASADIGLSLNEPTFQNPYTGKNLETIGLASGKFAYYMKCGIPTISLKEPCYGEYLKHYRFGHDIESTDELPGALQAIKSDYAAYSDEARRFFDEKLDFDRFYPPLKERLMRLAGEN
jgi:hypothetical protein